MGPLQRNGASHLPNLSIRTFQINFIYCTAGSHTSTSFLPLWTWKLSWIHKGCFHYARNVLQPPAAILTTCRDRDEQERWMHPREVISLGQVLITLVTFSLDTEEWHSELDGESALYLQVSGQGEPVLNKTLNWGKFTPTWPTLFPTSMCPKFPQCFLQGEHPYTSFNGSEPWVLHL